MDPTTDSLIPEPWRGRGPSISGPQAKIRGFLASPARLSRRRARMLSRLAPTPRTVVTP